MTSLGSLLSRLEILDQELAPKDNKDADGDKDLDEFSRVKKQAARQVADIRKLITERDELLEKRQGGTKETVEMSAKVRQQLRGLRENGARLKELQQQAAAKQAKKKKAMAPGEVDARAEVVDLVSKHIAECEQLEKRRYGGAGGGGGGGAGRGGGGRSDLMAGARAGTKRAEVTELQDLDDPEIDAGLKMLAQADQKLDEDLDQISAGVGRLKNIALDMQEEIKMQNVMVEEITNKVDDATAHLQGLNKKLKDTLDQVGGASRIIVNVILLVVVLAIVVYIYTIVKKKNEEPKDDGRRRLLSIMGMPDVDM